MAAIVSKLAAANRQRKANRLKHISIDKCVYILPPFDPCFKPEIHNRYVRTKHSHLAHQEFMVKIGTVSPVHIHQLEKLGDQSLKNTRFGFRNWSSSSNNANHMQMCSKNGLWGKKNYFSNTTTIYLLY